MEMQNRILSIIAHDVRNPIGAVKSIIELNAKKILSQHDSVELMNMAGKQIDGTVELLNNLVDWGSMQMRGQGFEKEKVHMRTLVSNMFKSFEIMASLKSNIMVNLVDEDLFIKSEINAMRFILRNLISNANKFTKEGVITVYAHKEENQVMMSVSDTGVGMTEEIKSKLTIIEVVMQYGLLPDRQGRLCCPFHEDKTPSFQVYSKTNTWQKPTPVQPIV